MILCHNQLALALKYVLTPRHCGTLTIFQFNVQITLKCEKVPDCFVKRCIFINFCDDLSNDIASNGQSQRQMCFLQWKL